MKVFMKTLVIAMVLCLALGCLAAQAVTELTESTEATTQTQVVLDLGEQPTSYTIVIPSQITIYPATGKGNGTITLKSGFVLTDITSLKVRLTDGYTNGNYNYSTSQAEKARMALKNAANDSTLTCYISSDPHSYIAREVDLIGVTNKTDNSQDYSKVLNFSVPGLPSYGKYTGTLTFSVVTE